jgi:hypothetical protein
VSADSLGREILTRATPFLVMPIFRAAPRDKSILRPPTYGPRSVIRTSTDFPLLGFVTRTIEPSGSVLEAAVIRFGSKRSPFEVRWPANSDPYHEAVTTPLSLGLRTTGAAGRAGGTGATAIGGGFTGIAVLHPASINAPPMAKTR